MFKKPFKVVSKQILKSSDKRKLLVALQTNFKGASESDWELLIPRKEDVTVYQIRCAPPKDPEQKPKIYNVLCVADEPLFYDAKPPDFADLYPTVYALWRVPSLLKSITVRSAVSQFVLNGADLMLPGILVPKEGLEMFSKHEKRCIIVEGNPRAIAIGRMAISSADATKKGMKGKAMRVFHTFHDHLYLMGSKQFPDGFSVHLIVANSAQSVESDEEEDGDEEEEQEEIQVPTPASQSQTKKKQPSDGNLVGPVLSNAEAPQVAPESDESSPEEMNQSMEDCFIEALKSALTDEQLPIDASGMYNKMCDVRPENMYLDVKKSSYKKLSKFIKEMNKKKFIKVKEVNNVLTIVSVNRSHPIYQKHVLPGARPPPAVAAAAADAKREAHIAQFQIINLYKPLDQINPLFNAIEVQPTDILYTEEDVKQFLLEYGTKNNLFTNVQQKNHIKLDTFLATTLFNKSANTSAGKILSITNVLNNVLKKMNPSYAIVPPQQHNQQQQQQLANHVIKKGKIGCVKLVSENVRGNKSITKIYGLDQFDIDFHSDEFQKDLRIRMSASVAVRSDSDPQSAADVKVQGNWLQEISRYLQTVIGIPGKFITTEDKTKRKKK